MAEGTVRGAFDLDTRPAIRGVREYRREAARADAQTKQLGATMDDSFGRQAGSLREMREEMSGLRTEMRSAENEMIPVMHRKTRAVREQTHAVRMLRLEVQRLGFTRANAEVRIDGIARAIAQVETLHSRINSLGRENATARVGVAGGFGSAASRAAAGAAGGGGGGGGGILSLGGLGFSGLRGGAIAAGALGILPAVQGLGGAAVGVGASGAAAAGGAGVVGLGGMGPLVAGFAGTLAVAKPANVALKEAVTLQTNLTKAVREYGRQSKEAAEAREALNRANAREPGMGAFMQARSGFTRDWRRATAPGRQDYFGMLTDVTRIGRRAAPVLGASANTAMGATRGSATALAQFGTSSEVLGDLDFFANRFAKELPIAERSLENSATAMLRLTRAASPFFHEANVWVENWTKGWADSVKDQGETRSQMQDLVDSGKRWFRLLDASWDLLKTIGSAGRPSGDSLVGSLTETFRTWDATLKANPAKTRQFFEDAANSTREMARAMSSFAETLHEVADLLRPTFDRVMQLLQAFGSLGLAGPGVGAALLGAYRGARTRGSGMYGSGVGTATTPGGPGMMPMPMGTGGVGGTGRYGLRSAYGTYQMQRQAFGATPMQAGRTAAGGMLARGAMPLAGAALRGAGKAFWPVALGMGLLDFASFKGNVAERGQAALSGATLGIVPRPMSMDERMQRAEATTQTFMQDNTSRLPGRRGVVSNLAGVHNEILRLQGINAGGADNSYKDRIGGLFGADRLTDDDIAENEKRIELLKDEAAELRSTNHEMQRQADLRQREKQRQAGLMYGGELPSAMRQYQRAGMSPEEAAQATAAQAGKRIGHIGQGGVEALGESSMQWARQLEKAHPEMAGIVDSIADDIEQRYRRMGRRIQIVNGDILTGSKREWGSIRDALASASEQAKQAVNEDFTAIQQKAIGSLRAMGFDSGQAKQLVSALEGGGAPGRVARTNIQVEKAGGRTMLDPIPRGTGRKNSGQARGGIVAGSGLTDTVPMGDGLVAPGEAWIANRHTMRDLSAATIDRFGFTAEQMIRGEHRRHSSRGFARGGMVTGDTDVLPSLLGRLQQLAGATGHAISIQSGRRTLAEQAALYAQKGPGLAAAPTPNAPHVRGIAADITPGASVFGAAAGRFGLYFPMSYEPWHIQLQDPNAAGGARAGALGIAGAGGLGHVKLRGMGMRQPGVPGLLRQRAGDMHAGALQKRINQTLDKMGGGAGGGIQAMGVGGGAAANMRAGHRMMLQLWGEDQWPALRELWMRESGWQNVMNTAGSGATGIPQALPGSKMASAGADWATNPITQIKWGLGYIRDRYGSPSGALAFHNSHNWYSRGGRMDWAGGFERGGSFVTNGPTHFVAGEGSRRRERVTVGPAHSNAGGGGVSIGNIEVHVTIAGGIKSEGDIDQIADRVGKKVAGKIIEAIDKGETAGVVG